MLLLDCGASQHIKIEAIVLKKKKNYLKKKSLTFIFCIYI